ncbi:MAG: helix-turn-helix domain-containing protein [Bacillota bacterium]
MFRIKKLRIDASLTQEKLARKVGISRIYLSELEPAFGMSKLYRKNI